MAQGEVIAVSTGQNMLKAMLHAKHLQEHRAFCRAYDKAARRVDPALAGQHPSKATFYRWLAGGMKNLPHPDHCRVLEGMFPGSTVAQLFRPWNGAPLPEPSRTSDRGDPNGPSSYADLVAAYASRAELAQHMPPELLFDRAMQIQAVGLSLNLICHQFSDHHLRAALARGARLQCLFLDPDGAATRSREIEEDYPAGTLGNLTMVNIQKLQRRRSELPPESRGQLELRVYDQCLRFNITIIDQLRCVVQPYLPGIPGVDSPTFVLKRRLDTPGMFAAFEHVFASLWAAGGPVPELESHLARVANGD